MLWAAAVVCATGKKAGRSALEALKSNITCGLRQPHSLPLCPAAPLQGIFSHPWFKEGLNPAALQFNDSIVRESLANQPSPEVLNEVGCERRLTAGWAGMRVHQTLGGSKSHAWAMPH